MEHISLHLILRECTMYAFRKNLNPWSMCGLSTFRTHELIASHCFCVRSGGSDDSRMSHFASYCLLCSIYLYIITNKIKVLNLNDHISYY